MAQCRIPDWLNSFDPASVVRIDVGLEGDWSASVWTLWSRESGRDLEASMPSGPTSLRPAAELYLRDGWIGVHCGRWDGGVYTLDEGLLSALVGFVEGETRGTVAHTE